MSLILEFYLLLSSLDKYFIICELFKMLKIRCKECKTELVSTSKIQFCGCPNQMSIVDNKIGAKDLGKVVMVSNNIEKNIDSHFSREELLYQEERRRRKVRRLDFEIK